MTFIGLVIVAIVSIAIDYPNLKRAKKEKIVLILYSLFMLVCIIISAEILLELDILNPNHLIAKLVYEFF